MNIYTELFYYDYTKAGKVSSWISIKYFDLPKSFTTFFVIKMQIPAAGFRLKYAGETRVYS